MILIYGTQEINFKDYHLPNSSNIFCSNLPTKSSPCVGIRTCSDYSPFGVELDGRTVSGGYRYGFSSKEKINEISGPGKSYDFGDRIFDPRLCRWMKIDSEVNKLPYFSSYGFVNSNPLRFIDPDGKFLIDVHKRIMSNAIKKANYQLKTKEVNVSGFIYYAFTNKSNAIAEYRDALAGTKTTVYGVFKEGLYIGSVISPDVNSLPKSVGGLGLASKDKEHFDNMNFTQINSNFNEVYANMIFLAESYKSGKINAEELGNKIGPYFHALQDLYSHSNYIELYKSMYGETSFDKIPTFGEVMSNDKFLKFRELLKNELHTGDYPGTGPNSHKAMNHDLGKGSNFYFLKEVKGKAVNWNSKAAEEVATKSTIFMNDKVEGMMMEKK